MLLHVALARCRQREAEQAAREHALARGLTAGRGWAMLARFAARRAASARRVASARCGEVPLDHVPYATVSGLRGAL